jgi:hypothetical protein
MLRAIEELPSLPVQYTEDVPEPLFSSSKMIDRDIAHRKEVNGAGDGRVLSYMRVTSQAVEAKVDIPECYRFLNMFESVDASPRTVQHVPGTFTQAELDMFDPIFRAFIQDCYKHGIPGPAEASKTAIASTSAHSNGSRMTPYQFAKQQEDVAGLPQDESFNPYWDIQAWRKWTEHVAAESHDLPSLIADPAAQRDHFTTFPGLRHPHSARGDTAEAFVTEDAEWWLSDECLADADQPGPVSTARPVDAPASSSELLLPQPYIVYYEVQKFKVPPYTATPSYHTQPLQDMMRITAKEVDTTPTHQVKSGTGMLRRPSKWLSRRMQRLRSVV